MSWPHTIAKKRTGQAVSLLSLRYSHRLEHREQAAHAIRTMIQHEENPGVCSDAAQVLTEISERTGAA